MGSDLPHELCNLVAVVSIHAPVWGATTGSSADNSPADVSIHAPVWGATVGVLDDFYKHVLEGKIENLQNLTLLFVTFL